MRRYGKIFLLQVLTSAPHRCVVNAQIARYTAIGHSGKIAVEHLLFAFCEPHLARYILCLGLFGVHVVDCFDMIFVFYAIIEPCYIAVFRSEMFEDIYLSAHLKPAFPRLISFPYLSLQSGLANVLPICGHKNIATDCTIS